MITPEKQKHTIYQGATWEWTYRVVDDAGAPVDLTGCTARLVARVDVADTTPVLDVTGAISNSEPEVTFTISPAMSQDKTWEQAGFDAELYFPGGRVEKLAIGSFKLIREFAR